ncbi:MAG: hypothetical protein ACD_13C00023G0004 [uncultured bacterium]|nr:MAG: hypothetical protein ACD_13C00023G0004 [uncultured bacterium]
MDGKVEISIPWVSWAVFLSGYLDTIPENRNFFRMREFAGANFFVFALILLGIFLLCRYENCSLLYTLIIIV